MKRLPPSLLVALGLGCGPTVDADAVDGENGSQSSLEGPMTSCLECLSITPDSDATGRTSSFTTGPCLAEAVTSACLLPPWDASGCLQPPWDTTTSSSSGFIEPTGTDTDTDTGTGSATATGSATETGSGSGSSSDTGAPDPRARALQRLLDAGVLPADIGDRLKGSS